MKHPSISEWESKGNFLSSKDSIFYIDENPSEKTVLLVLHGYPTSSYDYHHILGHLAADHRVIIPDFLGFGLSSKPYDHQYLLSDQADLIEQLMTSIGVSSCHIIAHDYGTSVFTELLARQNDDVLSFKIEHATLSNGSMLIHLSQLRTIQKLLKHPITGPIVALLSSRGIFLKNMRNIWYDQSLFDEDEIVTHWNLLCHNGGKKNLPRITRYINQRYENYDRWIGALKATHIPIHLIWAENDPVAIIDMAPELKSLLSNSKLTTMPNCGHYPMIEQAEIWVSRVLSKL